MTTTPTDGLEALRERVAEMVNRSYNVGYQDRYEEKDPDRPLVTDVRAGFAIAIMEAIEEHYQPIIEAAKEEGRREMGAGNVLSMCQHLNTTPITSTTIGDPLPGWKYCQDCGLAFGGPTP